MREEDKKKQTEQKKKIKEEQPAKEQKQKKPIKWFHLNEKYMSICRYAIFVIFAAVCIYIIASQWKQVIRFFSNMLHVLSPFLIGVLIAYFLNPMVTRLDRGLKKVAGEKYKKLTKIFAMIISYVVVLGFLGITFLFVIPQVGASIRELTEKIPAMYDSVAGELLNLEKKFPELQKQFPALDFSDINKQLASAVPNLVGYGTNLLGNVVPMVYSFSVSIVKLVINLVLGLIISMYMLYSKNSFRYEAKRVVYAIFSEEKGDAICTTFRECNDIFGAFLISKAIDSLIIGCICCVAMNILGLPYAVLLSLIVGITNMIPYFGPFIGAVPGVLIYLCTNWEQALIFAIMILVLQQFDGLILGPRLLGQSTGLSPIWVIFAITVGGAYFGVIGMFIGVPVVAVIAFLCNKYISARLRGRKVKALEEFSVGDKPADGSS